MEDCFLQLKEFSYFTNCQNELQYYPNHPKPEFGNEKHTVKNIP